jgi:hypothetical protein
MPRNANVTAATMDIDIGARSFHLVSFDPRGQQE